MKKLIDSIKKKEKLAIEFLTYSFILFYAHLTSLVTGFTFLFLIDIRLTHMGEFCQFYSKIRLVTVS